jgi:hypothetical protein
LCPKDRSSTWTTSPRFLDHYLFLLILIFRLWIIIGPRWHSFAMAKAQPVLCIRLSVLEIFAMLCKQGFWKWWK